MGYGRFSYLKLMGMSSLAAVVCELEFSFCLPFRCEILLKGSHSEELKKIKCVVQYAVVMAHHLILETSFLIDRKAVFSTIPLTGIADVLPTNQESYTLEICNTSATCLNDSTAETGSNEIDIPISNGFHEEGYHVNDDQIANSGLEDNSALSLDPYNPTIFSGLSSISASLKKVIGNNFPLTSTDPYRSLSTYFGLNEGETEVTEAVPTMKSSEVLEQYDLESRCGHDEEKSLDDGQPQSFPVSSEALLDLNANGDNNEDKMQNKENINTMLDSQSILVLMSSRNVLKGDMCEQSRFSHIVFYKNFDVPLGKFLRDNLLNQLPHIVSMPPQRLEFSRSIRPDWLKEEFENFEGSILNLKGSLKVFSDVEEMLKLEVSEFELSIQNAVANNGSVNLGSLKLSLNRVRWNLLLESFIWYRHLHSLLLPDPTVVVIGANNKAVSEQLKLHTSSDDGEDSDGENKPVDDDKASENTAYMAVPFENNEKPTADCACPTESSKPESIVEPNISVCPNFGDENHQAEDAPMSGNLQVDRTIPISTDLNYNDSIVDSSRSGGSPCSLLSSLRSLSRAPTITSLHWPSTGSSDSDSAYSLSISSEESCFSNFNGLNLLDSLVPPNAHNIEELDYIASLSRCKNWEAKGGKNKSIFAKTLDDRFIIKEINKTEYESFEKFAVHYFKYMKQSFDSGSQTCLAKVLGIYQVIVRQPKTGKELSRHDLMVMENLAFGRNLTRLYYLKGALDGRFSSAAEGSGDFLLGQNFVNDMNSSPLHVSNQAKRLLLRAVWNDTTFLNASFKLLSFQLSINVMDYSLLVGVDIQGQELGSNDPVSSVILEMMHFPTQFPKWYFCIVVVFFVHFPLNQSSFL
ncbi:putative 1-phosphatidylinositol-3-phosphate 5-kinase FAB1D-like isoform X3 [Hibiscus syriacus]|uniref:1-phosphatidylinositol-3-phosphate 5-kinase FAB1D-like isoform X3 n=1 Tax=Hibiscus syriacus TaxID=106335 RepID=A0A6A2YSH3_HIBSY|nr:putative 1-phosphatidylinositol-3-phosphate 5-kinase FAB1D-like isoform X3 [Hibiscus syriacus]